MKKSVGCGVGISVGLGVGTAVGTGVKVMGTPCHTKAPCTWKSLTFAARSAWKKKKLNVVKTERKEKPEEPVCMCVEIGNAAWALVVLTNKQQAV